MDLKRHFSEEISSKKLESMIKRIGKYEILEEIAKGAITNVYKAVQLPLGRPVTLKVLHENLSNEADIVSRFEREARACAAIEHDNIVVIYDYGVDGNYHYIAMEYVEGITLKTFVEKKISLPLDIFLFIAHEILNGLSFAHKNKIYHRDIKPGNILISNEGKVKITDFGLALISDSQTITLQNTILGTPAYMSPEQITGEKIDHRTDIFSLGVTFYELLSHKQPFAGKNYSEILNNVLNKEPDKLQSMVTEEFHPVAKIIHKMLARKADKRYQSCEEVRLEIREIAQENQIDLDRVPLQKFLKSPEKYFPEVQIAHPEKKNNSKPKHSKKIAISIVAILLITLSLWVTKIKWDNNSKNISSAPANLSPQNTFLINPGKKDEDSNLSQSGNTPIQKIPPKGQGSFSEKNPNDAKMKETPKKVFNPKPEKSAPGWVLIKCLPWAKINIDGNYEKILSESDSVFISLAPGRHEILWTNKEFAPYDSIKKIITIQPNDTTIFLQSFVRLARIGFVSVEVIPWGDVFIDEKKIGTTPLDPFPVKEGSHRLRINHPDLGSRERTFYIQTGEHKNFAVNLSEK